MAALTVDEPVDHVEYGRGWESVGGRRRDEDEDVRRAAREGRSGSVSFRKRPATGGIKIEHGRIFMCELFPLFCPGTLRLEISSSVVVLKYYPAT
jgi:hypothetical protein